MMRTILGRGRKRTKTRDDDEDESESWVEWVRRLTHAVWRKWDSSPFLAGLKKCVAANSDGLDILFDVPMGDGYAE